MSTDDDWEAWGKNDPYFGVITDPRFRRQQMNDAEHAYFFESGRVHAHYVIDVARQRLDPAYMPQRVLDFGCGVGRVLLPCAQVAKSAVGIDVSASMLAEARRNTDRLGLSNVEFLHQGDLSGLEPGSFDLVHSAIVLQHIDVDRGLRLFGDLVGLVGHHGVGAIQLTYSKDHYAATLGIAPAPPAADPVPARRPLFRLSDAGKAAAKEPAAEPVMQMNPYPLTPLFFQLQKASIRNVHVEFTDHGGELGVFLFFQRT